MYFQEPDEVYLLLKNHKRLNTFIKRVDFYSFLFKRVLMVLKLYLIKKMVYFYKDIFSSIGDFLGFIEKYQV
jgi:predicted ABC-type exoprotein transport system permease subunit